jgi:transcriptional regulator with XRE-family HTH domain
VNRVKELRESKKVKQIDLAKMLNVSQGTLSNWERGVHDPDNDVLAKIADFFSVTTDYLLGLTDTPTPEIFVPEDLKGVKVAFNRGEFEDLTQDEIDRLAEFAKFIKTQRREE